jgi:hypothetical protein
MNLRRNAPGKFAHAAWSRHGLITTASSTVSRNSGPTSNSYTVRIAYIGDMGSPNVLAQTGVFYLGFGPHPLSRRLICDLVGIAFQHGYSLRAVVGLVALPYLLSYKRREISSTGRCPVTRTYDRSHEGPCVLCRRIACRQ